MPLPIRDSHTRVAVSQLPRMAKMRQRFAAKALEDVRQSVCQTPAEADLSSAIKSGQRIAVSSGSRGIANIPLSPAPS